MTPYVTVTPQVDRNSHRDAIYFASPCHYQKRMIEKATGRESDKFMLRLPDGMRERLKKEAADNGRSLNAEIIQRLRTTLEMDDYVPVENIQTDKAGRELELSGVDARRFGEIVLETLALLQKTKP